jgi:hypothetical protein
MLFACLDVVGSILLDMIADLHSMSFSKDERGEILTS